MFSLALALLAGPVSSEVTLPAHPAPLQGTLSAPDSPAAVAVILPGSGPTDRDGNSPMGVSASTYRLLAEGLAIDAELLLAEDRPEAARAALARARARGTPSLPHARCLDSRLGHWPLAQGDTP